MKALIIVDVQNDFCPGGALAVPFGDEVVPAINEVIPEFDLVVATKDWHPANHISFQKWPVHCVQNTPGADFHPGLDASKIQRVFYKDQEQDVYSGFSDPSLVVYLQENDVTDVYVCGLATDYCVRATCLDAEKLGFRTYLVERACRGISNVTTVLDELKGYGIKIV